MSEPRQAAVARTFLRHPLRHRWPRGVFGFIAYLFDNCLWRYEYPVNWHDLMVLDDSPSAFMVCVNGGVSVFDGVEIDVLRRLVRGEADYTIAAVLGVRPVCVAKVRAKLQGHLGITTAAQLEQLAIAYGKALEC